MVAVTHLTYGSKCSTGNTVGTYVSASGAVFAFMPAPVASLWMLAIRRKSTPYISVTRLVWAGPILNRSFIILRAFYSKAPPCWYLALCLTGLKPDMGDSSVESHRVGAPLRKDAYRATVRRFAADTSGSHAIMAALLMPVLAGATAYGVETATLLHKQKSMQHAADSAALTAAVAVTTGANDNGAVQARAVATSYGFPTAGNINVQIKSPPTGGLSVTNRGAIEVIISQPQPRLFSSIWGSGAYTVGARAVATPQGTPCILALNKTASGAYSQQGSVSTNLINCSVVVDSGSASALSIGGSASLSTSFAAAVGGISGQSAISATYGTKTGYHYVADPYAGVSYPSFSGCDKNNYSTHGTVTLNPGVYCGGINLNSSASVTLNPGIYYLDRGSLSMSGQSSLQGAGVTLVFTSSTGNNYANANISGGATVNLVAPSSGPTAGIAIFGDRNMPVGTTFKLTGGDSEAIGGAVYLPEAALQWAGNATAGQHCTQIIADTVQLVGNTGLQIDCTGYGTRTLSAAAQLVE